MSKTPQLSTGQVISGPGTAEYTIVEDFGGELEGGLAKIVRAESPSGDAVAIKIPRYESRNRNSNDTISEHLQREADILQYIQKECGGHPAVMGYYEEIPDVVTPPEQDLYSSAVVADWIEGEILEDYAEGGIDDHDTAYEILLAVTEVIEFLHANQIVHRDLKLDNIKIRTSTNIKVGILDFNAAINLGTSSNVSDVGGTEIGKEAPGQSKEMYPPESAGSDRTDHPTLDIYMLGKIAMQLYTGNTRGSDNIDISGLYRRADFDNWLVEFIKRATDTESANRYLNAGVARCAIAGRTSERTRTLRLIRENHGFPSRFVTPGDHIGRGGSGTTPEIKIEGADNTAVSGVHGAFEQEFDSSGRSVWKYRDLSRNGTYLKSPGSSNWTYLLSDHWHDQRQNNNEPVPQQPDGETMTLNDEDVIVPAGESTVQYRVNFPAQP